MTQALSLEYPEGVIEGVKAELAETVEKAIKAGVRSWDIILDPGIGFAKSPFQSLDLLKRVGELSTLSTQGGGGGGYVYPVLVGASRKGFVGKITGREVAGERGWGDAVVNAFCTTPTPSLSGTEGETGVEILRVHDWRGARESVNMAKALSGRGDEQKI
jgi:dihydroneopterin aldolase/2-amino-4-hydroxy-6-hydroxymethyldihydropteridine diphosphokinase/dihydropteroate synthase